MHDHTCKKCGEHYDDRSGGEHVCEDDARHNELEERVERLEEALRDVSTMLVNRFHHQMDYYDIRQFTKAEAARMKLRKLLGS